MRLETSQWNSHHELHNQWPDSNLEDAVVTRTGMELYEDCNLTCLCVWSLRYRDICSTVPGSHSSGTPIFFDRTGTACAQVSNS